MYNMYVYVYIYIYIYMSARVKKLGGTSLRLGEHHPFRIGVELGRTSRFPGSMCFALLRGLLWIAKKRNSWAAG